MSLLDRIGGNLKKTLDFALEKGELGARVARLRLEIVGLNRQRDAAFTRLGRTYHANPGDTLALDPLLREIDRLAETVRDRESVLAQLSQPAATEPLALEAPSVDAPKPDASLNDMQEPPDVTR
jgi:hypothetical protein